MTANNPEFYADLYWQRPANGCRAAVYGFAAISDNVGYLEQLPEIKGSGFGDLAAIAVGWVVLGLVIFYPATQIAAIAASVMLFAIARVVGRLASVVGEWSNVWTHYNRTDELPV